MNRYSTIIITGAAGWLGSRLVEIVAHAKTPFPEMTFDRIRCFVLPGEDTTKLQTIDKRIEIVHGDVRSATDCENLCHGASGGLLLHTAGIIHPKKVSDFYAINVEGTRNVIEAGKTAGIMKTIIVSSNSPMGNNPHPGHVFDENSPYHPYMSYGRSKMKMEQAVESSLAGSTLQYSIIRAPWFYGTNQPPRQSTFFKMVREGRFPILGDGENRRSMTFIDNLCLGIMLAATSLKASGEIFWIADRDSYSMNQIVSTIQHLLETEFSLPCNRKMLRLPSVVGDIAEAMDFSLQSLGLYHQKIHVLSEMNKTIACTIEKAESVLDYHPIVDLEEGMRRSIKWCLDNGITI